MKTIGIMTVPDDFRTNMQSAFEADGEFGSHNLNNAMSRDLSQNWPTVLAMARLIEVERDNLLNEVALLKRIILTGDGNSNTIQPIKS
jgi:hypothetical protein